MNIWKTLGIKPTTDKKIIKLAYSIKLKAINHETQVLEFQELRQAYENALHYSCSSTPVVLPPVLTDTCTAHDSNDFERHEPRKSRKDIVVKSNEAQEEDSADEELSEEKDTHHNSGLRTVFVKDVGLSADAFMERCRLLYHSDFRTRYTGNEWFELVTEERSAWLKYNKQLSGDVFRFVTEHIDFAPGILSMLNGFFAWTNEESYWASRVPHRNFDIFLFKVKKGLFSIDHFDFKARVDFDRYFKLREELYDKYLAYMRAKSGIKSEENFRTLKQTLRELRKINARDKGLESIRKLVLYTSMATFFWVDKEWEKPEKVSKGEWLILVLMLIIPCAWPTALLLVIVRLFPFVRAAIIKAVKGWRDKYNNICKLY